MAKAQVQEVIRLFSEGKDAREIARLFHYADARGLSHFMRQHGYKWDPKKWNYVPEKETQGKEEVTPEAKNLLEERAEELLRLLDKFNEWEEERANTPFLRKFPGPTVTKGFRLPVEIDRNLQEFCRQKGFCQKDVIITAILEFLERYGEND